MHNSKDLQGQHFIEALAHSNAQSAIFAGETLTTEEMKGWIENREKGASMSLQTAKTQWTKKEKQILAFVCKNS